MKWNVTEIQAVKNTARRCRVRAFELNMAEPGAGAVQKRRADTFDKIARLMELDNEAAQSKSGPTDPHNCEGDGEPEGNTPVG